MTSLDHPSQILPGEVWGLGVRGICFRVFL